MFCSDCGARMTLSSYGRGAYECEDCGVVDYDDRKHPTPRVKLDVNPERGRKSQRTRRERS